MFTHTVFNSFPCFFSFWKKIKTLLFPLRRILIPKHLSVSILFLRIPQDYVHHLFLSEETRPVPLSDLQGDLSLRTRTIFCNSDLDLMFEYSIWCYLCSSEDHSLVCGYFCIVFFHVLPLGVTSVLSLVLIFFFFFGSGKGVERRYS